VVLQETFNLSVSGSKPPGFAMTACKNCGRDLIPPDQKKFCSHSCSMVFYNAPKQKFRPCLVCGRDHKNKMFCSYTCSASSRKVSIGHRREKNRVKNLAGVRRYQARRYAQTPLDADQHQITEIYAHCPDGHEVDHIIPVSRGGPHHQDNLQYLPMFDNRCKGNKTDP